MSVLARYKDIIYEHICDLKGLGAEIYHPFGAYMHSVEAPPFIYLLIRNGIIEFVFADAAI